MEFRTVLRLNKDKNDIVHQQKIMMFGSCFTEHIGKKLRDGGFQVMQNPTGILFNPDSIKKIIDRIVQGEWYVADEFFERDGLFYHYDLHSGCAGINPEMICLEVNNELMRFKAEIEQAGYLVITFGTAYVYKLLSRGKTVANCHKIPAAEFEKHKLGVNDIVSEYSYLLQHLQNLNPGLKIIFTISPVRHLRDGFVENQWSKSTLIVAVQELIRRFDHAVYFPAYEIMMDDLRDYRFCSDDLVHPNQMAVDYIWEQFSAAFFSRETKSLVEEFEQIRKAMEHRPFFPDSSAHQLFLAELERRKDQLRKKIPGAFSE